MKAIQVVKPGQIEIIEKEKPQIQRDNEVLIRVKMVGICGSDMHILHGSNPMATYPRIIGHEVTGEVVKTGKAVTHLFDGDKVVLEPIQTCGDCYACQNGRKNVCENLEVYGVHIDGGYQEYIVLPEQNAHKISNDLKWEEAVLIEPFTIGVQANWRGNTKKGDTVFIMGAGPIGITVLKIAKQIGATCVISDLREEKLAYAKSQGADYVLNAEESEVKEEVDKITNGQGANVVIDAVGTTKTFEDAVESAAVAGHVVTLGFSNAHSRIAQLTITKKELTISGSRLQTDKFPEVISLFNERKIGTETFITHHFRLNEFEQAATFIESHPNDIRKVVLEV